MFLSALVSLFVSGIVQQLLDQFSQNSVERWHISHGRHHYISVVIWITLCYDSCRVSVSKMGYSHSVLEYVLSGTY